MVSHKVIFNNITQQFSIGSNANDDHNTPPPTRAASTQGDLHTNASPEVLTYDSYYERRSILVNT